MVILTSSARGKGSTVLAKLEKGNPRLTEPLARSSENSFMRCQRILSSFALLRPCPNDFTHTDPPVPTLTIAFAWPSFPFPHRSFPPPHPSFSRPQMSPRQIGCKSE